MREGSSEPQFIIYREAFQNPFGSSDTDLLAVGGDLSPDRLIQAYSSGLFPWFNDDDSPILWWSPDPRLILEPDSLHVSRSLAKWCRQHKWIVTVDHDFTEVVDRCAQRELGVGTWITPKMKFAYGVLQRLGYAHSLEVWDELQLVGGIYGVVIGRHFYGESMFSSRTNGSKVALLALCQLLVEWEFELLDCQMHTPHLESLGAITVSRRDYVRSVLKNRKRDTPPELWNIPPFRVIPRHTRSRVG